MELIKSVFVFIFLISSILILMRMMLYERKKRHRISFILTFLLCLTSLMMISSIKTKKQINQDKGKVIIFEELPTLGSYRIIEKMDTIYIKRVDR